MKLAIKKISLSLLFFTTSVDGAQYYPALDRATFDITQLQLDVSQISELSHLLSTIASRKHQQSPLQLRANAMLLYLAIQLDSKNEAAALLNQSYTESKAVQHPDKNKINKAFTEVMTYYNYLNHSQNPQGKQVAVMIKDALKEIRADGSLFKEHKIALSRWKHLPPLESYQQGSELTEKEEKVIKPPSLWFIPTHRENIILALDFSNKSKGINLSSDDSPQKDKNTEWDTGGEVNALLLNSESSMQYAFHQNIKKLESFTIETWLHINRAQRQGSIISKMNPEKQSKGWDFWITDDRLVFEMNHSYPSDSLKVLSKNTLPVDQWIHLAVTYDGSRKASGVKLLLNGQPLEMEIVTDSLQEHIGVKTSLCVGSRINGASDLSEVKVHKIRLSRGVLPISSAPFIRNPLKSLEPPVFEEQAMIPPTPDDQAEAEESIFEQPLKMRTSPISILSPMLLIPQQKEDEYNYKFAIEPILIVREEAEEDEPLSFRMRPEHLDSSNEYPDKIIPHLNNCLTELAAEPKGIRFKVTTENIYFRGNNLSISGPITVGIGASLAGKQMLKDLVVCAANFGGQQLVKPQKLWKQIKALIESEKPHRVLVGKGGKEYFKQLLATDNIGFFITHEVLETSNVKQAILAATGSDQNLEKASAIFKGMQKSYTPRDIARLAEKEEVISKAKEILSYYPDHVSAQMILLWGSAEKPEFYDPGFSLTILQEVFRPIKNKEKDSIEGFAEKNIKSLVKEIEQEFKETSEFYREDFETLIEDIEDTLPMMESIARNNNSRQRTAEINLERLKEKIVIIEASIELLGQKFKKDHPQGLENN